RQRAFGIGEGIHREHALDHAVVLGEDPLVHLGAEGIELVYALAHGRLPYMIVRPRADWINQTANLPVLFSVSIVGLSSTTSMPTSLLLRASTSQTRCDSRKLRPPGTGVPTPGATMGSQPSRSKERWMPPEALPRISMASSRQAEAPRASISLMVYTRTPSSFTILASFASTWRTPKITTFSGFRAGARPAMLVSSLRPLPSSTESGMPWMLPEGLLSGVFMSVWASHQNTPRSRFLRRRLLAMPEMVPMAWEWSPPSTSGNSPLSMVVSTAPARSRQTSLITFR